MGRADRRIEKNGRYAKLKRWLYGMGTAASGWEDDYAGRLVEDGFQRGRAASTIFYHPNTQVRVVVHGDDFTYAGTESELNNVQARKKNGTKSRCVAFSAAESGTYARLIFWAET